MESVMKKKRNTTFKMRMMTMMGEMIAMTLVVFSISMFFLNQANRNYQDSMEQLLNLNEFFRGLESLNNDVYVYTLEGDEAVFLEITDACMEGRGVLAQMAEKKNCRDIYRDIRDIEEMFYSYVECILKIYDHSYLCDEMTIGSKRIINKYYKATQDVYEAIDGEFQNLYSKLLNDAETQKRLMQTQHKFYMWDMVLMIICTAFFEIFDLRRTVKRVIRPVQALTQSAGRFEGQDTEPVQCVVQGDVDEEMQHLLQVYNSMIIRIHRQVKEIQENASAKERLKDQELENLRISHMLKSSELKALQMQINPHFLFNTLNMISQTAYLENAEQTTELLGSTAKLLRYTLDYTDKAVTLAREIQILGNYVELQEQRFGERIAFEFDLDESFHKVLVPSMILQPLVENSISHGVGMKAEDAWIKISTFYEAENQRGNIVICDNGVGMDADNLTKVRKEMHRTDRVERSIGLSNVYLRLMIFFNYQAQMEIYSRPGEGFRVEIRIPCQEETSGEEKNVSDNNSGR